METGLERFFEVLSIIRQIEIRIYDILYIFVIYFDCNP
jgi:hypothetical protein